MKKKLKIITPYLLIIGLLFSLIPSPVFASETEVVTSTDELMLQSPEENENTTLDEEINGEGKQLIQDTNGTEVNSIDENQTVSDETDIIVEVKEDDGIKISTTSLPVQKSMTENTLNSNTEVVTSNPVKLEGVSLKDPTNMYSSPSRDSKVIKTYNIGFILKYYTYTTGWYKSYVTVNGKTHTIYISADDVENVVEKPEKQEGIALVNPTKTYASPTRNSEVLRTFETGSVLLFYPYTSEWYRSSAYSNGSLRTIYINKADVELPTTKPVKQAGIALNNPTNLYQSPTRGSKVLRTYSSGSTLLYYTYSSDWYKSSVWAYGSTKTIYIHKDDVEQITDSPKLQEGFALKNSTYMYASPSRNAKVLRTFGQGFILKYYTYTSNWYTSKVMVNGKVTPIFIHKDDVEKANPSSEKLQGIALKSPTKVYSLPSTSSTVLRSYPMGFLLKYYNYSENWYTSSVSVNGKSQAVYIKKTDAGAQISTEYDLTLSEAVDLQMKTAPQTDMYGISYKLWLREDAFSSFLNGKGTVRNETWNIRRGPGTNYPIYEKVTGGTLPLYASEKDKDGYTWYHVKSTPWGEAARTDVEYYVNPANFISSLKGSLQFLLLSQSANINVEEVNAKILSNKGVLAAKAQAFVNASREYRVNEIYLISHALLESGNGTSKLASGVEVGKDKYGNTTLVTTSNRSSLVEIKKVYNMYGINAKDTCALECGAKYAYEAGWDTIDKAIIGGAAFVGEEYIGVGQDTLYKMRWNPEYAASANRAGHQYASDIGWAYKQTSKMHELYSLLENYILVLDIPKYK